MLDRAHTTNTRLCMHGTGHLIYSGCSGPLITGTEARLMWVPIGSGRPY